MTELTSREDSSDLEVSDASEVLALVKLASISTEVLALF